VDDGAACEPRPLAGQTGTMPGCVLRIRSKTSRVEDLVQASGLKPIVIHKKGYPRVTGAAAALSRSSGFNVNVSNADGVLEQQARDAVRFLKNHARGLARLRRCRAFGGMTLDFGIYDLATMNQPWPSYRLPVPLVELAGKHGVEIELSFYGVEAKDAG
jgi:hypothetical protein